MSILSLPDKPWKAEYERKLTTPEKVAALVRDGDVVCPSGSMVMPQSFCQALNQRLLEVKDVTIVQALALSFFDWMKPEYKKNNLRIDTIYGGVIERILLQWGTVNYIPIHLSDSIRTMLSYRPRILGVSVTPPNEDGYMNFSLGRGLFNQEVIDSVEILIVEVNPSLPWVNTDLLIHVSQVDYILEKENPVPELPPPQVSPVHEQIASYIVDLIPDGATIQLGIGDLPSAIGHFLRDKKDLGIHTEIFSPIMTELMEMGVVNNSRKTLWPGKSVCTLGFGDKKFYEYVDRNENIQIMEVTYVNDPVVIAQNDNLISINNMLSVDLSGQVASESIGPRQFSGSGGQVNFARGAQMSKGGKSFLAMESTYKDKEGNLKSRIVPVLPEGTIVTTPRTDVQYIVTEYGIVNLRYKSIPDRVKALISIAHPDFRDFLEFEARRIGWLY